MECMPGPVLSKAELSNSTVCNRTLLEVCKVDIEVKKSKPH